MLFGHCAGVASSTLLVLVYLRLQYTGLLTGEIWDMVASSCIFCIYTYLHLLAIPGTCK